MTEQRLLLMGELASLRERKASGREWERTYVTGIDFGLYT